MAQENQGNSVARFTGKQLAENPALLERLFLEALVNPNKAVLPVYIQIYESVPNADRSLIDWAKAILEREEDLNKSVASYRKLISDFPENNFIRYQLAETLFYNQEYEAAKTQFERLRASTQNSQDVAVFDKFIEVIDSKENWNFSFSTTFLNDKNLQVKVSVCLLVRINVGVYLMANTLLLIAVLIRDIIGITKNTMMSSVMLV